MNKICLNYLSSLTVTCRQPADIFFIVDSSGSINNEEFNVMKNFVKDIAMKVGVCMTSLSPQDTNNRKTL